jgi:hypothetical protein
VRDVGGVPTGFSPPQATCPPQVTERASRFASQDSCATRDVGVVLTGLGEQSAMTFRSLTSR